MLLLDQSFLEREREQKHTEALERERYTDTLGRERDKPTCKWDACCEWTLSSSIAGSLSTVQSSAWIS